MFFGHHHYKHRYPVPAPLSRLLPYNPLSYILLLYILLPYILLPYILLPYNACHCSDFLGHHKNDLPVGLAHTDTAEPAEIVN